MNPECRIHEYQLAFWGVSRMKQTIHTWENH